MPLKVVSQTMVVRCCKLYPYVMFLSFACRSSRDHHGLDNLPKDEENQQRTECLTAWKPIQARNTPALPKILETQNHQLKLGQETQIVTACSTSQFFGVWISIKLIKPSVLWIQQFLTQPSTTMGLAQSRAPGKGNASHRWRSTGNGEPRRRCQSVWKR